jgi:hypothetical protein
MISSDVNLDDQSSSGPVATAHRSS